MADAGGTVPDAADGAGRGEGGGALPVPREIVEGSEPKNWTCTIGECHPAMVPIAADPFMRRAVEEAYQRLTGQEAAFVFSGWGSSLPEEQRAVVENRLPSEENRRAWLLREAAPDLAAALEKTLASVRELERWLGHDTGCCGYSDQARGCDCGLRKMIDRANVADRAARAALAKAGGAK